jgi:hypothetical protein
LKTNNPAKSSDFAPNDINDLRPLSRNRWFRWRNISFRFRRFWGSSALERKEPGALRAMTIAVPSPRPSAPRRAALESSGAKRLRKRAAKPMKSLRRVTLRAGAPDLAVLSNSFGANRRRRMLHGLEARTRELDRPAARNARTIETGADRPRRRERA